MDDTLRTCHPAVSFAYFALVIACAMLDVYKRQAHTADYMRSAEFAVDMGMNQDDGTLNGGFPVLPWQGGTVLLSLIHILPR